ncbi:MAG: hypothetical protein LBD88_03210 [Candidatus Peribacteria bacterium]|jgi:peptidoglycan hydrolase CwlO-like protein|nr:hypothetical protein [Candidatus Peribacteria bacterium]
MTQKIFIVILVILLIFSYTEYLLKLKAKDTEKLEKLEFWVENIRSMIDDLDYRINVLEGRG